VHVLAVVDDLYASFVATLPRELGPHARALAHTLKLAPSPDVPWSEVFGHAVTLAAPALFAEAMPGVPPGAVRSAVLSQALAAIEAFGTDRIEDKQVVPTTELVMVLEHARRARNTALRHVWPIADPEIDFEAAHGRTLKAIAEERSILTSGTPVDFATYERTSLGKQSIGFPPTLALARRAGWSERKRRVVSRVLASIWLGLQMPDDVHDWEDDFARGGAWAVALSGGSALTDAGALRPQVFGSGVLPRMLERGRRHFRAVHRLGAALGLGTLSSWGEEQEKRVATLVKNETEHAGYTARAHALIAWAGEVLG
jgi:hypothetical protein